MCLFFKLTVSNSLKKFHFLLVAGIDHQTSHLSTLQLYSLSVARFGSSSS